ncbi:MAG TPA: sulfur carrier protein ThiS [Candidatus Binataceae bacterium]|nr:sulfur carrier protein ThiS [Candidatus Binataceae bacterium]
MTTQPHTISITLNGEPHRLAAGISVSALIEQLKMRPARIAVELNGEVVPKARYTETMVREGDRLEVINFVGGG